MKLTKEQVEARITMYNEVADHLLFSVHDSKEEERQSIYVRGQILRILEKFYLKYQHLLTPTTK